MLRIGDIAKLGSFNKEFEKWSIYEDRFNEFKKLHWIIKDIDIERGIYTTYNTKEGHWFMPIKGFINRKSHLPKWF